MRVRKNVWYGLVLCASVLAVGIYLTQSIVNYGAGYPLDDAWIHLTYARNLVMYGQWMFLPGKVSGGSTSPLWTLLLTPAFLFHITPVLWTSLLGILGLSALAILGERVFREQHQKIHPTWILILVVFEWHFVWAALSGMETLLQTVGNLLVIVLLYITAKNESQAKTWGGLGLTIGVMVCIRPDSITWLGPAAVIAGYQTYRRKHIVSRQLLALVGGFLLPFGTYLLFNRQVAGSIWPNTMYAKQAEYAAHLQIPFLQRYFQELALPFIGVAILMLPGLGYLAVDTVRKRDIPTLVIFLWWLGMAFIYALRLPVTYQHGRYMIPGMIVPLLFGFSGTLKAFQNLNLSLNWRQRLRFAGQVLFVGLQTAFYVMGAGAYRDDVGIIQTEMVKTAQWVADNIPQDKKLAVHDIGAMGFYGQHTFIDLAGLINPEVIPFIRNEQKLAQYLDDEEVDFVVVFPGWYNSLLDGKVVYYSTNEKLSPSKGGNNMTVYCWKTCQ